MTPLKEEKLAHLEVKQGFLKKVTPGLLNLKKLKYVRVSNRKLKYYEKIKDGKLTLKGIINFDLYQCFVSGTHA